MGSQNQKKTNLPERAKSKVPVLVVAVVLAALVVLGGTIFDYKKLMPGKALREAVDSTIVETKALIEKGKETVPQELAENMKEMEAEVKKLREKNESLKLENISLQNRVKSLEELGKVGNTVQEDLKTLKSLISNKKEDQVGG